MEEFKQKDIKEEFQKKIIKNFSLKEIYGLDMSSLFYSFKMEIDEKQTKLRSNKFIRVIFYNNLASMRGLNSEEIEVIKFYYFSLENPEIFVQSKLGKNISIDLDQYLRCTSHKLPIFTKIGQENKHLLLQNLYLLFPTLEHKKKFLDKILKKHEPYIKEIMSLGYHFNGEILFEKDFLSIFFQININNKIKVSFYTNEYGYRKISFQKIGEKINICELDLHFHIRKDFILRQKLNKEILRKFLFPIKQQNDLHKIKKNIPKDENLFNNLKEINKRILSISKNNLIESTGEESIPELFHIITTNQQIINVNKLSLKMIKSKLESEKLNNTMNELAQFNILKVEHFISNQENYLLKILNSYIIKNQEYIGEITNFNK